jgi:hypothetical protein
MLRLSIEARNQERRERLDELEKQMTKLVDSVKGKCWSNSTLVDEQTPSSDLNREYSDSQKKRDFYVLYVTNWRGLFYKVLEF